MWPSVAGLVPDAIAMRCAVSGPWRRDLGTPQEAVHADQPGPAHAAAGAVPCRELGE